RPEGSAPAARRPQALVGAALLDDLARARHFLRDLRVIQEVALAFRVGARDALPGLELAQLFLGAGAVLATGRGFLLRLLGFLALLLRVFLTLTVGGLRAERLVAFFRRGGGGGRGPGRRRLQPLRRHAGRRH